MGFGGTRHTRSRRRVPVAAAALTTTMLLSACGNGNGGSDPADGDETLGTVTVGVLPLAHVAPLYIAIEQGYFEDEGLEVVPEIAQGGAAIVPAMVSGDYQLGYSNYVSMFLAQQEGLDLRIVSENDRGGEDHGVFALPEAGIAEPADFAGKTVAVNTLNNIGFVAIATLLQEAGVAPEEVTFTEIPFPDMIGALERGDVDAAWLVEPFVTAIGAALPAAELVLDMFAGTTEGLPVAGWVATSDYAGANSEVVAAFLAGLQRATDEAEANPDLVRDVVPTYSPIEAETAAAMTLPTFAAAPDVDELQRLADLMVDVGMVDEAVDVGALVAD